MVMAPALPYLGNSGVANNDNNPEPSKAKVDTGVSFSETDVVKADLNDMQQLGIWNMMKNADDPSHVAQMYRSHCNSKYCTVPKPILRHMRDTMIKDMREHERNSPKPRKQTQIGRNAPHWNDPKLHIRRGA